MDGPSVNLYLISCLSVNSSLISCLFITPFNFGYAYIISNGLNNVYIKNSSENLTESSMIHEMYGCQCMTLKEIKIIFVSVKFCSATSSTHPPEGKETIIKK